MQPARSRPLVLLAVSVLVAASLAAQETPVEPPEGPPPGWSVGVGVVSSPRPYRGTDSSVFPVPVVEYHRRGFYLEGVRAGYRWLRGSPWSVELFAVPQFREFDQGDSPALAGMARRRMSVDAGVETSLARRRFTVSLSATSDVLGRSRGQRSELEVAFPFATGQWRLTPSAGARWESRDFVEYYYGVRPDEATPLRPVYGAGSALNSIVALRVLRIIPARWAVFLGLEAEFLDSSISRSPIVDRDSTLAVVMAATYRFGIDRPPRGGPGPPSGGEPGR